MDAGRVIKIRAEIGRLQTQHLEDGLVALQQVAIAGYEQALELNRIANALEEIALHGRGE